eukprot:GEMP01003144.1.p1 GENE.GEMP01003144.1~~GEMP01003144.1.p1  ORF type:complete len:746 (+),score=158.05 GEMP01003144.1:128-2365(+)
MDCQPLTPGRRSWSASTKHFGLTYSDMQQRYSSRGAPLTLYTPLSPWSNHSSRGSPMNDWSKEGHLQYLYDADGGRYAPEQWAGSMRHQQQYPLYHPHKSLSVKESVRNSVLVEPEREKSPTASYLMKRFDDYPLSASVANNELSSTKMSNSCSGVESHQAAARAQEAMGGICVLPCAIKENNWHSSAIVDYKIPMSPMSATIQQNMQTMTMKACRSWGVFDDDDSMSPKSPRSINSPSMRRTTSILGSVKSLRSPLVSSLSMSPSSRWETYQVETPSPEDLSPTVHLPLPKSPLGARTSITSSRDYKNGSTTELDPDTLIWIHYSETPEAMPLPPFTTVRKLRAHLARLHDRFIPQVSLFDYDTLVRIPPTAMNLPPPQDIIIQLWSTNPLPFAPTFYEHAYAEDNLTTRDLIEDCLDFSQDSTKDLDEALWYYTKHAGDSLVPVSGLQLLLENGANANTGDYDSTPLYNAVLNGRMDLTIRLIDAKADVRKVNQEPVHWRPLQAACFRGSLELAKLLLGKGALADEPSYSEEGYSAIHCAVHSGKVGMVGLLVKHGAGVERSAANGDTPLLLAIQLGRVHVCNELMDAKANVNRMVGGKSMIHWAAEMNDAEAIEMLVKHGAAINAVTEKEFLTPIHIITQGALVSRRNGRPTGAFKYLLMCQADVNRPNYMQETPLFSAVKRDCAPLVRELIRAKADVHRRNRRGRAALHYALSSGDNVHASNQRSECARLLLDAGAQLQLW